MYSAQYSWQRLFFVGSTSDSSDEHSLHCGAEFVRVDLVLLDVGVCPGRISLPRFDSGGPA